MLTVLWSPTVHDWGRSPGAQDSTYQNNDTDQSLRAEGSGQRTGARDHTTRRSRRLATTTSDLLLLLGSAAKPRHRRQVREPSPPPKREPAFPNPCRQPLFHPWRMPATGTTRSCCAAMERSGGASPAISGRFPDQPGHHQHSVPKRRPPFRRPNPPFPQLASPATSVFAAPSNTRAPTRRLYLLRWCGLATIIVVFVGCAALAGIIAWRGRGGAAAVRGMSFSGRSSVASGTFGLI
jgi:hypothetical protein